MGQSSSSTYPLGGGGQGTKPLGPLTYHTTHSDNIELSPDRRRARRRETFCKGICFSARPIAIGEKIFLRFAEVSSSWSGVLRFGFTTHDPVTIQRESLPRYACPDLTSKPGFWAKALPERFSHHSNVLTFHVTRTGDVIFGVNGEEKGVFFSGVSVSQPLWALIDIYGNTTAMEFIDGRQLNNLASRSTSAIMTSPQHDIISHHHQPPNPSTNHNASLIAPSSHHVSLSPRYHTALSPLSFHEKLGRNVGLSSDRSIAVRNIDEYCNGYVFTERPLRLGERIVVQIMSTDHAYTGGLAFGMTACDPAVICMDDLPDDSDLLLDRPEYWVVNKDVCSNPEVADELSFHLTDEGEIRYGKNGHHVATLMHVDKSLPMWAFFDVYGNTQKIKLLGVTSSSAPTHHQRASTTSLPAGSAAGLTVHLPPPTLASRQPLSSISTPTLGVLAPARPPPPALPGILGTSKKSDESSTPALPPKLPRPSSQVGSHQHRSLHTPSPTPRVESPETTRQPETTRLSISSYPNPPFQPTAVLSRKEPPAPPVAQRSQQRTTRLSSDSQTVSSNFEDSLSGWSTSRGRGSEGRDEAMDNASNECSVCLERPVDCVLYTCGHACMCYECASGVKRKPNASCPICRQEIKDIIKIYRS